jgi:hypothetical protein
LNHLRATPPKRFQPSNAHFGLMPELGRRAGKKIARNSMASARESFAAWLAEHAGVMPFPRLRGGVTLRRGKRRLNCAVRKFAFLCGFSVELLLHMPGCM